MKTVLKVEEAAALILGVYLYSQLELSWWWFVGLFLTPDLSMLGYLFGAKTGAWFYNLFHLKSLGIVLFLIGITIDTIPLQIAGLVIFSHSAFDRMMGYGLKYKTGFKDTHLGRIGN